MSSSVTRRTQNPRQRARQANPKRETKTESEIEKTRVSVLKEMAQKGKRSSSLSKNPVKAMGSPQKSRSVDRSMSNRYSTENISIKSSLVDTKKAGIGNKRSTISTSNSKTITSSKKGDSKITVPSNKFVKTSDKSSRSPMKGPSGKTNIEIAKSFVRHATDSKAKKVVKNNSTKKSSEKSKSETSKKETSDETDRPRTSTIRKGPLDISDSVPEQNNGEIAENKNLEYKEFSEKKYTTPAAEDDDDDKVSYEEDFEDYDSDFEESDSDSISYSSSSESIDDEGENILDSGIDRNSISGNSTNENRSHVYNSVTPESKKIMTPASEAKKNVTSEVKKKTEKSFLRMSDRSFISSNKTTEASPEKKTMKSSHSFINFASAVEQEEKKKYANRVAKRASELLEIITLNDVSFTQIDIPPMKYDTYIRFYGKTDSKQVFVQTENFEEEEVQTDEIEMVNKWTQNPPNDNFGYGGDTLNNTEEADSLKSLFNSQNVKLSSFLQNCSKVILTLLDEEFPISTQIQAVQRRNELFYSDGYYVLPAPSFLKDVPVLNVYCNPESSQYVLTLHDGIIKVPVTNDERGVICVWNFLNYEKPEHILVAHSQPTCVTFGPAGNDIIIAGMVDGTVLLWDLSNNSQAGPDESSLIRTPTYSTAVILGNENHHSCIIAIQALISYSKNDSVPSSFTKTNNSRNFHVLTLEDMGMINIWVVVEVLNPDFSGLDTDLGLAPGGKLRLVRSSSICLHEISALQEVQKINIRTFDFRVVPLDSNRILVTTDSGIVLHVNRQGGSADPRFYSNDLEFSSEIRSIDCSPHNEDLFLFYIFGLEWHHFQHIPILCGKRIFSKVGCSDGSAMLYNLKLVHPMKVFLLAAKGDPVTLIQWSPIHPAMFIVLSSSSNLYLWNLLEDCLHPINSYHFSDSRVSWFTFCKVVESNQKPSQTLLHMFISRDDGETEVHIFKHRVTKEEYSKQLEFMKNL